MIESGYNPYAYSPAKAAGLWQFMVATGRRYGLTTDFWIDERRDPILATEAAARYLADLRDRFHGDWYLAWAGYNAGEGRVDKAITRESTVDFWRMMSRGRTLRAETKHYVPKLLAAALISKHPERFGFRVAPEAPFEFDEVDVPAATSLAVLARAAGSTVEELFRLNPAIRRFCTPPEGTVLRIPRGRHDAFVAALAGLPDSERLSFVQHKLEKGESLSKLARAYGVSEALILKTNGLKSQRQIKKGSVLTIPLGASKGLLAGDQLEDRHGRRLGRTLREPSAARAITARPSARYGEVQRARELALAQGKADPADEAASRAAQAAQREEELAARRRAASRKAPRGWLAQSHAAGRSYVVKPGDSLWTIAGKLGISVDELRRINRLSGRSGRPLQVGQRIATGG
jgi:membrane-bound lytic murein transglycosylase D